MYVCLLVPSKSTVKIYKYARSHNNLLSLFRSHSCNLSQPLGAKHFDAYHTAGCPFDIFTLKSPWEAVTELCDRICETACYIES